MPFGVWMLVLGSASILCAVPECSSYVRHHPSPLLFLCGISAHFPLLHSSDIGYLQDPRNSWGAKTEPALACFGYRVPGRFKIGRPSFCFLGIAVGQHRREWSLDSDVCERSCGHLFLSLWWLENDIPGKPFLLTWNGLTASVSGETLLGSLSWRSTWPSPTCWLFSDIFLHV